MLLFVLGATACQSSESGAREHFSRDIVGPLERVTAVERPKLSAYDLTYSYEVPGAEIAADPGRLALWEDERRNRRGDFDGRFKVTGCEETKHYGCGGSNKQGKAICLSLSDPPP